MALRLIWLDPHKLDPTKIAAKATREVADILSRCKDNPSWFPLFIQEPHRAPAAARGNRRTLGSRQRDWRQVEPAIFDTLLEQALDPAERRKLGAHYTPRAYVERLVAATVLEPLKEAKSPREQSRIVSAELVDFWRASA